MRWVGLVRNVMIGRDGLHRSVLLDLAERAGAEQARSHLTTGNLTFDGPTDPDALVTRLERGLVGVVQRPTLVVVRPAAWLSAFLSDDPFSGLDVREWETEVGFLRHDHAPLDVERVGEPGRTLVLRVGTREMVTARPRSGGHRPHVNRLLETATGSPATARGWQTLQRLAASG